MRVLFLLLHVISIFAFTGWIFVWFLHLMAILNAKLKLYKKPSYTHPTTRYQPVALTCGQCDHCRCVQKCHLNSILPFDQDQLGQQDKKVPESTVTPRGQVSSSETTSNCCKSTTDGAFLQTTPSSLSFSLKSTVVSLGSSSALTTPPPALSSSSPSLSQISKSPLSPNLVLSTSSSCHMKKYSPSYSPTSSSLCSKTCLPFSSCHRRPSSNMVPCLTNNIMDEAHLPSVSIIKPLVGVDPYLSLNLESFFLMNYPRFELLFCIADEKDAVIPLVYELIAKYPHVPSKVFVGGCNVGTNPKINNMQPGYEAAKAELILISDSGIHMKEDTLRDMVSSMTEDIALVHQMPYTMDRSGFPAILEKVYFGTAHARIYLAADLLGVNCPTGMSALMRKSLLDEVGGIKAFGQYLAEDFFFAKSFTDRGWQIRIANQPALQNSSLVDVESFHNRISRWAKLRIAMLPHLIILEPLSECLLLGIFAAWSLNFLFSLDPFAVYLFHILFWFMLDFCLLSIIQQTSLPFSKTDFVIAWFFRESTALLVFFKALLYPEIHWRTGTYKLKWGGIAEEVTSSNGNKNNSGSINNSISKGNNNSVDSILQHSTATATATPMTANTTTGKLLPGNYSCASPLAIKGSQASQCAPAYVQSKLSPPPPAIGRSVVDSIAAAATANEVNFALPSSKFTCLVNTSSSHTPFSSSSSNIHTSQSRPIASNSCTFDTKNTTLPPLTSPPPPPPPSSSPPPPPITATATATKSQVLQVNLPVTNNCQI